MEGLTPEARMHLPIIHRLDAIREYCKKTGGKHGMTRWEQTILEDIGRQRYLTRKQLDVLERVEKRMFDSARK